MDVSERLCHQFASAGCAELAMQALDVVVHGVLAAFEFVADFADGLAFDEAFKDVLFARREPGDVAFVVCA